MKLIYRAQTLEFTALSIQSNRVPVAVNWRYRVPGKTYAAVPIPVQVCTPKAINWR